MATAMKRLVLSLVVVALYAAHQDLWFWRTARPLVFGFLPIGLFYHACFSVAAALVLWLLVTHAWPKHLEEEAERSRPGKDEPTPGAPAGSASFPPERDSLPRGRN